MSEYRQQLEDWLKTLDVKADTVYDIGGGQGEVKSRVKSWDVQKYQVMDLPQYDLNQKNAEMWANFQADIIFCLEVFEYLFNPVIAMHNIAVNLKPTGKAYVTFAFVYPHHNELEADSLRYTEPGIKRLAKEVGLKVNNIWYRRDKSGLLKSFYSADGMRASKQYPNHDVTGFIVEFSK